jgi:hypothetical protein
MTRVLLLSALFIISGCKDEGSDTQTAKGRDAGDEGRTDGDDLPRIRTVHVSLEGDFVVEFDISSGDESYVLPVSERATFAVVTTDDSTPTEQLNVAVVNAETGEPVDGQETIFRNGLWRVSLEVEDGLVLGVAVSDASGNTTRSKNKLVLTPLIEAVVGDWEIPFYDETHEVTHFWTARFNDDGTWSETHSDSGVRMSGRYESDKGQLRLLVTESSDSENPDDDPETTERARVGDYYVDEIYFTEQPWLSKGETSGLSGTWERSHRLYEESNDELLLAAEVNEQLVFDGDGAFTLTKTEIDHRSATITEHQKVSQGIYEVQRNEGYMGNYGDFLIRTTTTVDDLEQASPLTTTELHTFRARRLLISPRIRVALED